LDPYTKEENVLRLFGDRVLRRIFGPNKEEEAGKGCIMRSSLSCTLYQILLG
jgi:hypothetical protein